MVEDKETLFIDNQFFEDCQFLEETSPDPAIDLLALMAIIYKRKYFGNMRNWTDMPVKWGMDVFKLSYDRYNSALDRLVEYGIVQQMSEKHHYRKQMKYRYIIREDYKHSNTPISNWKKGLPLDYKKDAVEENVKPTKEVIKTESTPEKPKQTIKLPPMVDGKVQYRVLKWTGKTVKFQDVSKEEYEGSATCIICGNNFDPTQFAITFDAVGIHPEEFKIPGKPGNACIACGAKACVESERGYLITGTQYDPGKRYREDWLAKEKEITELRDK